MIVLNIAIVQQFFEAKIPTLSKVNFFEIGN